MTSERWQQVKELFRCALEQDKEERAAFLIRACGDDDDLRREVETLVASYDDSDSLIVTPVAEEVGQLFGDQGKSWAGQKLGHYEITSLLGEGGMGAVYLARDMKLGRRVAIKFLPSHFTADKERLARFEQEARAASSLNHPNILTIYEIGKVDGQHFIATEFIDGKTLRQRMADTHMGLGDILEATAQIASALAASHEAGIVHRDIKPENVMLRRDGYVKVLDFGLAKLIASQMAFDQEASTRGMVKTDLGVVMGTVRYMSPEQQRGLAVDARTDIWSLGCVLYEMVAGRVPFEGDTTGDVIAAILQREPLPLVRYAPDVPTEVDWIVRKALRKDREERYQTAKELLSDLKNLKRRLDFKADLGLSDTPPGLAAAATSSGGHLAAENGAAMISRPTSSAEYVASQIKKQRFASIAALVLLLLAIGGLGLWYFNNRILNTSEIESIAVLPFQNVAGGSSDTEYLSDGISEALINSLTELRQLKVIARSTAFRYKDRDVDPRVVGRDLNVRAVLMGRVRQVGDRLNIQVDLVDTTTGAQLWGENYERKPSDLLSVKQTIAREVTEKLRLRLSGEEQRRLVRQDTTNAEAYAFYLRGRYFWNKRTEEGTRKAITEFQQAIDRDPNYALGYVGLADCYLLLELYANVPSSETLPKARAAVDHALQIDDSLSEAYASSAYIHQQMWRWAEAEQEYKRAISLSPNYPIARFWFGLYFRTRRQLDDALREMKRAHELDPLSPVIGDHVAFLYLLKNDLNSAVEQAKKVIELDPSFPLAHETMGYALLKLGRHEEATEEFQKTVELSAEGSRYLSVLGYCYAVTGRQAEALRIAKDLEQRYARREALGQHIAGVYAGIGDRDKAFSWLERDFEQRSGQLPFFATRISFEGLRGDSRYTELIRRMGLTP